MENKQTTPLERVQELYDDAVREKGGSDMVSLCITDQTLADIQTVMGQAEEADDNARMVYRMLGWMCGYMLTNHKITLDMDSLLNEAMAVFEMPSVGGAAAPEATAPSENVIYFPK